MEKLRFTQLFHESEKVLTDEEKFKIILDTLPDDEKTEIEENYEAAIFEGKLEDFFEDLFDEYKDILDNAKSEETSEAETVNDDADGDSTTGTDLSVNTSNEEADDEVETTDEQDEKEQNKAVNSSKVSGGKSKLVITDTYNERIKELLNAKGMEKDFEQYERYFGYTSTGKKDFVEVMFHTPEYWPIKTGQLIKKDDPLFHTVACMNEFLIWKMGVEIYNKNEKIKGIFDAVLKSGKSGSELNSYVKEHWKETWDKLNVAKEEIETGTTSISDPFERSLEDYQQKNNIIIFMFMKIFPTILKAAKTGKVNGLGSCTAKVLGSDNLYKKLYQIGRGEVEGEIKDGDSLTDLIYDSYYTFLGGRIGVRSFYEKKIRGKALIGTANARPLCVFDDNWTGNKSALAKNVFLKMDLTFSEKNPDLKFNIDLTRKPTGKGSTKAIGVSEDAYAAIASGASIETLQKKVELGEIDEKQLADAIKAMQFVTTQKIEIEPFTVIASTVASDFRNFLSCMTRVGARNAGVFKVYGKKYWSKDEIDDETNPVKKAKKIEDNKAWDDVRTQILNFNPRSMDAPTTGKDGDTGTTFGDLIASKEPVLTTDDKITLSGNVDVIKFRLQKLKESILNAPVNTDADRFAKIKATFALLCLTKYIYMALTHWEFTPIDALNAVIGKTKVSSSGRYDTAGKKNHPLTWEQSDWIRDVYSDKSELNNAYAPFPIAGLYDTKIGKALAELRSPIGLAYTAFTPEGIKQIDGDIKEFTQGVYTDCKICLRDLGFDIDRIKTDDDMFNIKFDNKLITKPSQIVRSTLFKPGISEFNDDISVYGANWFGPTGSKSPDYKPQRQDWFEMSVGKMLTQSSLETIVNNDEYKDTIEEVKKLTGVDLYDLMQQILEQKKKEKNKGFDLKKAIAKQNPDAKIAQNINSNRIFVNNKETPAKKFGDKLMQVPTKGTYVIGDNTDTNYVDMNDSILSKFYNQFFGEIFREASEKEKTKKQRFTIN